MRPAPRSLMPRSAIPARAGGVTGDATPLYIFSVRAPRRARVAGGPARARPQPGGHAATLLGGAARRVGWLREATSALGEALGLLVVMLACHHSAVHMIEEGGRT